MNGFGATARMIWIEDTATINHYVLFRREFTVDKPLAALTLRIAADSDFIVVLDGVELGRGQFTDDPSVKTWSDIALEPLNPGTHRLAIQCYYNGVPFSGYAPGAPGVAVRLFNAEFELVSDTSWRALPDPAFRAGEMPKRSWQLCFTSEYDARRELPWRTGDCDDSAWPFATVNAAAEARDFRPRPVGARPELRAFRPGKIVRQGVIQRAPEAASVALSMTGSQIFWGAAANVFVAGADYPVRYAAIRRNLALAGFAVIADLGDEEVGFIEFELDAPAGTVVDYAHGEHLDDGRVRAEIFSRNFADRYICHAGRNVFQLPFQRIGGRYLELHIRDFADATVTLNRVGVVPWELPLPPVAEFTCSDARLTALRTAAIRTLELCMHEHYEDCPWREQALYNYDSRNQMLYGYYLWGNGDFAAASLNLWHEALREDGQLRLCAPSRLTQVIPIFTLIWPVAIYEHWLYTGSNAVFAANRAELDVVITRALASQDAATGLKTPCSRDFWQFYEWAPELSQVGLAEGEVHSLYNLYLIEALRAYAGLLELDGGDGSAYRAEAERLGVLVERLFYDAATGVYASKLQDGKLCELHHEHTQILMLFHRLVPEAKKARLMAALYAQKMVPLTLSPMLYLFRTLAAENDPAAAEFLRRRLYDSYLPMLEHSGGTTLWETVKGGDDFVFAGSLCHGWSSLPVYFCAAQMLGVTPLEPGFKRFLVSPRSFGESRAAGTIPTPAGAIKVAWQRNTDGGLTLTVRHPAALTAEVRAGFDTPLCHVDCRGE